jgi:hypothetical protein
MKEEAKVVRAEPLTPEDRLKLAPKIVQEDPPGFRDIKTFSSSTLTLWAKGTRVLLPD